MSYPQWLIELFTNNNCTECKNPVTPDDIDAIGVRRPMEYEAHLRQPLALVVATCKKCGQTINFSFRCPLDAVIDVARAFAEQIETDPVSPSSNPLADIQRRRAQAQETPPTPNVESAHADNSIRPSLRSDQPAGIPSESEIRAFLNRLKRTSFKRGTKGFARWMNAMGVDPDAASDTDEKK